METFNLSKSKIKSIASLDSKKNIIENGVFLIEGKHIIDEAIASKLPLELYALNDTDYHFATVVSELQLSQMSRQKTQQGFLALTPILKPEKKQFEKVLFLDRVSDPGNLGTLIRSAVAFGFDAVFVSKGSVFALSPKVVQASQGALFKVPVFWDDEPNFKDVTVFGTILGTKSLEISELKFASTPFVLILGNEANGIDKKYYELISQNLRIDANFESLNLSVAGSLIMYIMSKLGTRK